MELGCILNGNARHAYPLAVRKANQMGAHALLRAGIGRNVAVVLEVIGIPETAVLRHFPALFQEFLPLRVAHLAALDGPPPGAVPVNDAFAGDAHVVPLGSRNARPHGPVLQVQGLVGREEDHGTPLQMQIHAVLQDNGAGEIQPFRHHQVTAALFVQGRYGLLERLCIEGLAVGHGAEIPDIHRMVRNLGLSGLGAEENTSQHPKEKDMQDFRKGHHILPVIPGRTSFPTAVWPFL